MSTTKRVLEGTEALRCLSGDIGGEGMVNVRCPHCGYDYVHLREFRMISLEGESALEVVFWCEGGDCPPFSLVIRQHKGNEFIEIHA